MKEIKDRILGSEKIEWKKLKPFQPENLKTMTEESFSQLKNNIANNSFTSTFDVWKESEDNYWILDGHHRQYALQALEKEGHKVPAKFHCTIIQCQDKQDACYVLASKASSHAKVDELGFSEWATLNNLDFQKMKDELDITGINFEKIWGQHTQEVEEQQQVNDKDVKTTTCPNCAYVF